MSDILYKKFAYFALFWMFLGWLGFILALSGFFYEQIFLGYLALGVALFFRYFSKKTIRDNKEFFSVSALFVTFIILLSFFATPSVFSGRDQGSISEAAIRLSQNHELEFTTITSEEFFDIYGEGKALNFPGFHYTQNEGLITQFPVPYISWLAIFYSIFGISGLIIANTILLYLFLSSIYLLFRLFAGKRHSWIFLLLLLTSFSFSWFFKFTLSENMALSLLWLSILSLTSFLKKNQQQIFYFSFLATGGFLIFTRIEGIAFFAMGFLALLIIKDSRRYLKNNFKKAILLPLLIFSTLYAWNFFTSLPFYKEIGKAFLGSFDSSSGELPVSFEDKYLLPLIYIVKIHFIYGMLGFLIAGTVGIFYFIKKKKYEILIPVFIVLPSFIYLVESHISSDHPWMLRRFIFAILPVMILYSALLLSRLRDEKKHKKIIFSSILIILLLLNAVSFLKYLTFSENKNLLKQTEALSQQFSDNDLILIDRLTTGSGWANISGPMSFLYNKNAVYLFNPSDLKKIDLKKFNRIYLVTPNENIDFWKNSEIGNNLNFHQNYYLETIRLESIGKNDMNVILPEKETIKVNGKIFEYVRSN